MGISIYIHVFSTLHILHVKKEKLKFDLLLLVKNYLKEACRPFFASFFNEKKGFFSKGFDPEQGREINLVVYGFLMTVSVNGKFFLPSKSENVVYFNNIFGSKRFL